MKKLLIAIIALSMVLSACGSNLTGDEVMAKVNENMASITDYATSAKCVYNVEDKNGAVISEIAYDVFFGIANKEVKMIATRTSGSGTTAIKLYTVNNSEPKQYKSEDGTWKETNATEAKLDDTFSAVSVYAGAGAFMFSSAASAVKGEEREKINNVNALVITYQLPLNTLADIILNSDYLGTLANESDYKTYMETAVATVTLYVNPKTYLPVRATLDLTQVVNDMMAAIAPDDTYNATEISLIVDFISYDTKLRVAVPDTSKPDTDTLPQTTPTVSPSASPDASPSQPVPKGD